MSIYPKPRKLCHGRWPVWDSRMQVFRCPVDGHRQSSWEIRPGTAGLWVAPRQTRELAPWWWPVELLGRFLAKRSG